MGDYTNPNGVEQVKLGIVASRDGIITKHVEIINKYFSEGGEKHEEIGKYILKHFYNDDAVLSSSRKPNKGVGYRNVAKHPDLEVSAPTLNRYVRTAVQSRFLNDHGIELTNLSYGQKLILLPLPNDAKKVELARKAITDSLRGKKLQALIAPKPEMTTPIELEKVSEVDLVVQSLQALTQTAIDPLLEEINRDELARNKLKEEAENVALWMKKLIEAIDKCCIRPDTEKTEPGNAACKWINKFIQEEKNHGKKKETRQGRWQ